MITPSLTLLTIKQLLMIDLYAQGHSLKEIGRELDLPAVRVGFHLKVIQHVVGAETLDEAVELYKEWRYA
jgi:DNA-binding CsgD family transcriptional regulator